MPPTTFLRAAAAAVGVVLLLGGCSAATAGQGDGTSSPASSADFGPYGPDASDRPDPVLSGEPVPTLPPGDPGTGPADDGSAADGDQPGDGETGDGDGDGETVASVPGSALVDQETVGALAGGSWSADASAPEACTTAEVPGATASRLQTLASAGGRLVERVSAHPGPRAAKAAVPATARLLAGCGFTPAGDPRLGQASAQLTRPSAAGGEQVAVVIASDGVTVVLVATGSAADPGVWESLADIALGTSCAADAHGCH